MSLLHCEFVSLANAKPVIAGTAHSIPVLILGGAFLGLGASVQLTYATVISELIPNKNRAAAIGTLCFATIPAQAFGTIIAREFVLNTKQGWRWPFYLGLIMNALSVALYYLCYHPPTYTMLHARRQTKVSVWKMLDVVGALLFTIGLLLLLLGLSWGGQIYPWKTGKVIGTLVSGFVTLVMFVFWEIYGAGDYPLVPMRFFKNPGFVGVLLTAGIANASWAAVIIIWPIQLAVIWPNSYAAVGWKSCIGKTMSFRLRKRPRPRPLTQMNHSSIGHYHRPYTRWVLDEASRQTEIANDCGDDYLDCLYWRHGWSERIDPYDGIGLYSDYVYNGRICRSWRLHDWTLLSEA